MEENVKLEDDQEHQEHQDDQETDLEEHWEIQIDEENLEVEDAQENLLVDQEDKYILLKLIIIIFKLNFNKLNLKIITLLMYPKDNKIYKAATTPSKNDFRASYSLSPSYSWAPFTVKHLIVG